ncbi:tRNA dihydrouridine synthase [Desulfoplanes formicivorans]|uniref:tRNA-dihydrouridine synthase n=1 Tax=Desulfoplanes formicivorans TaxID=1592317 RepID=A0A194AIJ6_9BACT|nr:tRNA-dihydrouridine synthase family protein [Desulfoplanes formicivorans]GAU09055.1 dihydrouridine synthase [Desulfoplanes formicivorans]
MSSLFPISPHHPWLAPLAGFTDLSFRLLCRELGASVACTEMISAKGLVFGSKGTRDLLATCPEDTPLVVQLFGAEPEYIARAMDILLEQGFRYFDLNSGCPVKKVVKTGSGAALLKTPALLVHLVKIMADKAGTNRVGVKIRLGWRTDEPVYLDLAPQLEKAGAAWITLHPRSARQGFAGQADWTCLAELVKQVSVPVIASGDLLHAEDGVRCLEQTGVAAIMFARGALNDPAIFRRFHALMQGKPLPPKTAAELVTTMERFMALSAAHGSEARALLRMRTLAPRFVRDFPGSRAARSYLTGCRTWEDFAQGIQRLV